MPTVASSPLEHEHFLSLVVLLRRLHMPLLAVSDPLVPDNQILCKMPTEDCVQAAEVGPINHSGQQSDFLIAVRGVIVMPRLELEVVAKTCSSGPLSRITVQEYRRSSLRNAKTDL